MEVDFTWLNCFLKAVSQVITVLLNPICVPGLSEACLIRDCMKAISLIDTTMCCECPDVDAVSVDCFMPHLFCSQEMIIYDRF